MDPTTAMMIAQLGMSGINIGMGIHDRAQAKKGLAGLTDPVAEIPQSAYEDLARKKFLASSFSLPGQQLLESEQDQLLSGALGDIFKTSSSSTDALEAISGVYGKRMKTQNQIGKMAADSYIDRNYAVSDSLLNMANEEKRVWDLNVMNPFMRKLDQYYGLLSNGNNLISGGSSQAMSAVGGYAQNKQIESMLKTTSGNTKVFRNVYSFGASHSNPSNPNTSIMMDNPNWDYTPSEPGN